MALLLLMGRTLMFRGGPGKLERPSPKQPMIVLLWERAHTSVLATGSPRHQSKHSAGTLPFEQQWRWSEPSAAQSISL